MPPEWSLLTPGQTYLARLGNVGSGSGINIYAPGSAGLGDPLVTIGHDHVTLSYSQGIYSPIYGRYVEGMFCPITIGEGGSYTLQIFGIDHAWFIPQKGEMVMDWIMKGRNGISEIYTCNTVEISGCQPFQAPWGNNPGPNDPPIVSGGVPVAVTAIGSGKVSDYPWRVEYQSCDAQDANNDFIPGIRSTHNYLASNCCSGANDDGGNGGGGDGDDDGGGGR